MFKRMILVMTALVSGGVAAALADDSPARSLGDEAWARGDFTAAARWYTGPAQAGDAAAQTRLGWLYRNGRGVAQDYGAALNWFSLAARQGNPAGEYSLALLYQNGQGVRQDLGEAVRWYRAAATQGNAVAQNNLGWAYQTGRGVSQDYAEAARWYRLAASQGQRDALGNLGLLTLNGQGVPADRAEGERLLRLAAAQGDRDAAALVARLGAGRPAVTAASSASTIYGLWRSTQAIRDEGLRQMYLVLKIKPNAVTFTYDCRFLDGSIVTGGFATHAEITDSTIRILDGGSSQATTGDNQCAAAIKPVTLPYRLTDSGLTVTFKDTVVTLARAE
jgi:TPR repeat protein